MRGTPLTTACAVGLLGAMAIPTPAQEAATSSTSRSAVALGDSLMEVGRTTAAVGAWRTGLATAPNDVTLLWKASLGLSSLAEETPGVEGDEARLREAIDLARRAVRRGPGVSRAHTALAIALGRYGRHLGYTYRIQKAGEVVALGRQAYEEIERARALDPSDYAPYVFLGAFHRELATVHPLAKAVARTFLGGYPDVSLEESAALLERAIDLDPESVSARVQLARTRLEMDRPDEARTLLGEALVLEPRSRLERLELERLQETLAART
ncbi:MAG: tetratricopeptide repeat protein [Gemmatimonadota bacterium]